MNRRFLLDTSALIALLRDEPGADKVAEILDDCEIHAIHLAETARKLALQGVPVPDVKPLLDSLQLPVNEQFRATQAYSVAEWATLSKQHGLSFADCSRLAMGYSLKLTVVTADRKWSRIESQNLPEILQIRP